MGILVSSLVDRDGGELWKLNGNGSVVLAVEAHFVDDTSHSDSSLEYPDFRLSSQSVWLAPQRLFS